MDQRQKNTRKMFTNVLQFFGHAGAPLLGIKKISELVKQATADVAALDAEALRQPADTTGITRTRTEVKKEAATKAEALRGLVLGLSEDPNLLAALRKPVSGFLYGADAGFLTYCQQVLDGLDTLDKQELKDAGYDADIRTVLVADLKALHETTGEAVQMQTAGAAATDNLGPLFDAVEAGLARLDKFVHFQQFAQPTLVAQYEALRVRPKTPAAHAFRAKGSTPYNVPQLVITCTKPTCPPPPSITPAAGATRWCFTWAPRPPAAPAPAKACW